MKRNAVEAEQFLRSRDATIEQMKRNAVEAEQSLRSRDATIEQMKRNAVEAEQSLRSRDATIEQMKRNATKTSQDRDRAQQALRGAKIKLQQRLSVIETSTIWRMTAPLRTIAGHLPKTVRLYGRHTARVVWWLLTPHRMPARLRFLRDQKRLAYGATATHEKPPDRKVLRSSQSSTKATNARREPGRSDGSERDLIASSALFDADWYLKQYPDVAAAKLDPALHYLRHGAREGRDPSALFSTRAYLDLYPSVAQSGINPLVHYLKDGQTRGLTVIESERPLKSYETWVAMYDTLHPEDRAAIRADAETLSYKPLLSVVMPVYNAPREFLLQALDSVLEQLYAHWELCVADDCSPDPEILRTLATYQRKDPRIKVVRRDQNGNVAAASNSALALATGEFVALMDHDDILPAHALYMVAVELNRYPEADIVYSDEDKIDRSNIRYGAYFKSDWNPDLMRGQNMISHLGVYRRSLLESIGGFRLGYEGSQDYDLALRAVERTTPERIRHIPHVLYHWRVFSQSGSFSASNLPRATRAARQAVQDHSRPSRDRRAPSDRLPAWTATRGSPTPCRWSRRRSR